MRLSLQYVEDSALINRRIFTQGCLGLNMFVYGLGRGRNGRTWFVEWDEILEQRFDVRVERVGMVELTFGRVYMRRIRGTDSHFKFESGYSCGESPGLEEEGTIVNQHNRNLHGNAPDKAEVALLMIDVINDLEFPEGADLLGHALPMARSILELKKRAKMMGFPVIYVNDNFGRWQSNFHTQIEHCLKDGVTGQPLAEMLVPDNDDYFVLKPKHSGFFSTTLDTLLEYLGATTLILTGIAGNICVLFTANDAYMRDFQLIVPGDCVASNTENENRHALSQMKQVLKADTRVSAELDLNAFMHAMASDASHSPVIRGAQRCGGKHGSRG